MAALSSATEPATASRPVAEIARKHMDLVIMSGSKTGIRHSPPPPPEKQQSSTRPRPNTTKHGRRCRLPRNVAHCRMDSIVCSTNIYQHTKEGIIAYGNLWPKEHGGRPVDEAAIEAMIYDSDALRLQLPEAEPKYVHFARLVQHLQPPDKFVWHRWTWECAELWCDNDWWTCLGPSSSGKSCVFGVFALIDWCIAPCDTVTVMVSTTLEMVKERIYLNVVKHYDYLPARYKWEQPFDNTDGAGQVQAIFRQATPLGLLIQDVSKGTLTGAGIKCVGFKAGDKLETIKGQLGRHMKRMRLLVDELQGTNPAVLDLPVNMFASGDGKFGGFGNPSHYGDPLATASTPEGGAVNWPVLDKRLRLPSPHADAGEYITKKFKTERGECLFLDGLECPSIREPEKYHYLLDPKHIAKVIRTEGLNSAMVDTYIRGIFPSGGTASVVLDADEAALHGVAAREVVWHNMPQDWISLDLGQGGTDAKAVRRLRVGKVMAPDGTLVNRILSVELHKIITDNALAAQVPITLQIARQVKLFMILWHVPINRVGGDSTATQGATLDAIETLTGTIGIHRIGFAGAASDKVVKEGWPRLCKEEYANRASELAGLFRELCLCGIIKGLDSETLQQASQRRWLLAEEKDDEDNVSAKQIDPNKRINGKSPDALDTMLVACMMLREAAGIFPRSGPVLEAAPEIEDDWLKMASHDRRRGGGRIGLLVAGQSPGFGRGRR